MPDLSTPEIPPRFSDAGDRAAYLLAEYKIGVYIALAAGGLLLATGRLGIPSGPYWLSTALSGISLGIIPAMVLAKFAVIDPFVPDPRAKVEVWNPYDDGISIEHKKVPNDLWQEREHEEGLPLIEPDGETDAIVTRFERDETLGQIRVRGCDPDVADPASIQAFRGRLDKVFGDLADDKQDLKELRATMKLRQIEIEEQTTNALVAAVERGTTFEPAGDRIDGSAFDEIDEQTGARSGRSDEVVDDGDTLNDVLGPTDQSVTVTDGGQQ